MFCIGDWAITPRPVLNENLLFKLVRSDEHLDSLVYMVAVFARTLLLHQVEESVFYYTEVEVTLGVAYSACSNPPSKWLSIVFTRRGYVFRAQTLFFSLMIIAAMREKQCLRSFRSCCCLSGGSTLYELLLWSSSRACLRYPWSFRRHVVAGATLG